MKNQNQNKDQFTGTGRTQETIIPKVRYHPTIQTQTTGDGARAKTRISQTQKTRAAAVRPPKTGTDSKPVPVNQDANKTPQVDPAPAVRPRPGGGRKQGVQTPVKKPNQKQVQGAATDPDPPQTPDQLPGIALPRPEQVPLGLGVQLDRSLVEEVEVLTRGQSTNQDWFMWRKNRITASVAHRIAHCRFVNGKSKTPPTSYLAAVTGEGRSIQTRAMSWGVQMEAEVVRRYQRLKSAALGRSVSVQDCGLFIDAQRPWLAASPDGIVTDSRTGQRLLCLEVKCPYKHRHKRVEDACVEDPAFCLEIQDQNGQQPGGSPVYRLKTSHSYFTQIQCQLAVTGLRQADLAVFTLKETAVVPVTFDPDLWQVTVSKLEVFYRDGVLPHLRGKTQQDSAAWTPEP
ncbi:uncharacterized protein LOC119882927 [Micropterus salmoides]|uniref:uncharacterized protein LOC119882927 n=1 Tax=Micropterus salmoides TaxID=27706 RepID=UPI0018EB04EF|nr:uncharacterized protein LOC119882927 [Micropterus salmoides]XP_038549229.1 uncharacterized protein LOC119882927 [Micropterus salmoides]XP_038549230.1 uncharacterized protein LOC119882927 [Micropterus salmoides]XP_038549231.1 uncharacterized protein LOC119882927 [Micropterus salmoides]